MTQIQSLVRGGHNTARQQREVKAQRERSDNGEKNTYVDRAVLNRQLSSEDADMNKNET